MTENVECAFKMLNDRWWLELKEEGKGDGNKKHANLHINKTVSTEGKKIILKNFYFWLDNLNTLKGKSFSTVFYVDFLKYSIINSPSSLQHSSSLSSYPSSPSSLLSFLTLSPPCAHSYSFFLPSCLTPQCPPPLYPPLSSLYLCL